MLDKGVGSILNKAGHGQSASTTEKISDGVRSGFKKLTGKDVPIKDSESSLCFIRLLDEGARRLIMLEQ